MRSPGAFSADKYVRIPNIPVFRADKTKDNDGNELVFGPKELDQLAQQCNKRIQESGDYAGIIVGHTSDKEDVIQRHPEVIGYAGPFHLGTMGNPGEPTGVRGSGRLLDPQGQAGRLPRPPAAIRRTLGARRLLFP